jgi:TldD protein
MVASPLVTLVDDGTMGPEWGALCHRRRGPPAGRNVLIENGVLTEYMWDWLRARKEGRPARATAGGRATSICRWCA